MSKYFRLRIISAHNLIAADSCGTSDPYVKIKTANSKHKTKHIKKTLNPHWDEECEIEVEEDESIKIRVFDHDTIGTDDPIGDYEIPLSSLSDVTEMKKEKTKEFTLANVDHGSIKIGFTPVEEVQKNARSGKAVHSKVHQSLITKEGQESNLIRIRIIAGHGLAAKDRGNTSDPYVRLKSQHSKTVKTKVIEKTLDPRWNESFLVDFEEHIDFQVYDQDMIVDEEIGSVRVTLEDIKGIFEDKTKETIKQLQLNNNGGILEVGFTASGSRVPKTGLLLSALGGREKIFIEKGPLGLLCGVMFVSFILGFVGWIGQILFLALIGGYALLWKGSRDLKEKQEYSEKETKVWKEHNKIYSNLESVEWINKTLENIYIRHGNSMGKFMANTINPYLELYKPGFLKSIKIDKFNFGVKAPKLDAFRVDTSDNDQMVLFCNVSYFSDMTILISVQTVCQIPILVEKIVFFGKARITVQWDDRLPYAGKLLISLMELPLIDFKVRPLKGMDLTGVPGLSPWINDMINNMVINEMFLFPKKLEINILPPLDEKIEVPEQN
jgi:Ca2+-dependent lipid-binding protein